MAIEQFVLIDEIHLPLASEINDTSKKLGYDFYIDETENLSSHSGFLPIRLNGKDTGFETYYIPIKDIQEIPNEFHENKTNVVITRTFSDFKELYSATIYLRIIVEISNDACLYEEGQIKNKSECIDYFESQITEIKKYIEEQKNDLNIKQNPKNNHDKLNNKIRGFFSVLMGKK